MRESPCVEIVADVDARLDYLLRDYAYLGADGAALAARFDLLHGLQSNETLARWKQWAVDGDLAALFRELMTLHYDPLYARSQHGNFLRLATASRIEAASLDEDCFARLAERIVLMT